MPAYPVVLDNIDAAKRVRAYYYYNSAAANCSNIIRIFEHLSTEYSNPVFFRTNPGTIVLCMRASSDGAVLL